MFPLCRDAGTASLPPFLRSATCVAERMTPARGDLISQGCQANSYQPFPAPGQV